MIFQHVQICVALAVFVAGLTTANEHADNEILVKLDAGYVRGTTMTSSGGHNFFAFRGIPYAEPPKDELRFKPPVSKLPWGESGEIFDATEDGPVCPQTDTLTSSFIGQEDCLFVNVYTPKISSEDKNEKYPVLVFIHGGGFKLGMSSSWMYGPHKFMDHGIVFVTLNYRLNALGFLSTDDESSVGNYGLLDQREALRWVQTNIGAFGGDPNKITISGHSAGSVSVLYHMISPMSKGLFHRAISLSGSPVCLLGHTKDASYWAKKLATSLKCSTSNSVELIECLRKIPAEKIESASQPFSKIMSLVFLPVVDKKFVPKDPRKLMAEKKIANKVPVLMGITTEEGAGVYAFIHGGLGKYSDEFLKLNMRTCLNSRYGDSPEIIKMIKEQYFNNKTPKDDLDAATLLSKLLSDGVIDICHYETAKFLIDAGIPTHLYSYDFAAEKSLISLFGIKENLGVAHGDELPSLFQSQPFSAFAFGEKAEKVSKTMTSSFANFVKFGVPTPNEPENWPVTKSPEEVQLYHIDDPPSVSTFNPFLNPKINFWLRDIPRALKKAQNIKDEL